ncbi:mRNA transport regulator 3 [Rickenella mellea]|uniref:mRNA transport regulator 3 n=1 Tax=Rickenella mellea TaxID=50990 RepID=A0A4Y7QAS9_9AGAM|nr:mRNA transport regulator 3 [Rickenella mellea]
MAQALFDRRRVNGPEESFPPVYDSDEEDELSGSNLNTRQGRSSADIRPIYLKPGLINQANGSAYIETEKTKIACAVYGPRQSRSTTYNEKGKLNVEVKFAPFSCTRRRAPMRDAEDRSIAVLIQQALIPSLRLELLPKSTIDVFIVIIENDGIEGCVASGSIAASTALANAGIEMLGLVTSCAASVVNEEIWLDPTVNEARLTRGTLLLGFMPALGIVTNVWQTGQLTIEEAIKSMELCKERCLDIHSVVAQALLDSAKEQ